MEINEAPILGLVQWAYTAARFFSENKQASDDFMNFLITANAGKNHELTPDKMLALHEAHIENLATALNSSQGILNLINFHTHVEPMAFRFAPPVFSDTCDEDDEDQDG